MTLPLMLAFLPDDLSGWFALIASGSALLIGAWAVGRYAVHTTDNIAEVPGLIEAKDEILDKLEELGEQQVTKAEMLVHIEADAENFGELREMHRQTDNKVDDLAGRVSALEREVRASG